MTAGREGWPLRVVTVARSYPVSVGFLIASNLVPLIGVLFLGWDVPTILYTYWLETGIVGLLNVPKILLVMRAHGERFTAVNLLSRLGFFTIHYGIFFVVNGLLVAMVSGQLLTLDPFAFVLSQPQILFAAAALFISHLVSLRVNFIGHGEYKHRSPDLQQYAPYPRMLVLQLTVLFGGFAVWGLGQPAALVALLVLFKTVLDLALHLFERANAASSAQGRKGPNGIETTRAG